MIQIQSIKTPAYFTDADMRAHPSFTPCLKEVESVDPVPHVHEGLTGSQQDGTRSHLSAILIYLV